MIIISQTYNESLPSNGFISKSSWPVTKNSCKGLSIIQNSQFYSVTRNCAFRCWKSHNNSIAKLLELSFDNSGSSHGSGAMQDPIAYAMITVCWTFTPAVDNTLTGNASTNTLIRQVSRGRQCENTDKASTLPLPYPLYYVIVHQGGSNHLITRFHPCILQFKLHPGDASQQVYINVASAICDTLQTNHRM